MRLFTFCVAKTHTRILLRFPYFGYDLLRRMLDWRFGSDLDEMKVGFSMQFFPPQEDGEMSVEWTYKGTREKEEPAVERGFEGRGDAVEDKLILRVFQGKREKREEQAVE